MVTNNFPCSAASAVAAVSALSAPPATITASGPVSFCTGSNVVLSAPAGAGYSYQWYNGGTAITGATNVSYTASASGNYTVRVTLPTGCTNVTSAPTVVTVVASPYIVPLSPTSFCWGGGAVLGLSTGSASGLTYQWRLGGSAIAGATNNAYSANTPGIYTCTITLPACTASTAGISVNEFPMPNPVITFDGTTLRTGNWFTSYQWYKNATLISGATGPAIIPSGHNGSFTVHVTDTNGCQSVAEAYVFGGATTGITNANKADVKVFPNPAHNSVSIQSAQPLRAVISAMDGRTVIDQNDAQTLDISSLTPGAYLLSLYDKDGQNVTVEKLVKE